MSLLVIFFTIFVAAATLAGDLPSVAGRCYLAASIVTFALYALDKRAAVTGRRRTPEKTLHILALLGGWPGAALAQSVLHHKSRKTSFRMVFVATVTLNCTAFLSLYLCLHGRELHLWS